MCHTGGFSSYLMPAAALGAMGYCYMWWKVRSILLIQVYKFFWVDVFSFNQVDSCFVFFLLQGLSFSDVMFVTKSNMATAVSTVSKQLENVSEALAVSITRL